MKTGLRLPIAACSGAVLLLAACGGSARLSETAFQTQASTICAPLNQADPSGSPAARFERKIKQAEAAEAKLRALHPPAKDERVFQDFLERMHATIDNMRALEPDYVAYASGTIDPQRMREFEAAGRQLQQGAMLMVRDAQTLGLSACGDHSS